MDRGTARTQNDLDALLSWLDRDRAEAGRKYESIRRRLIVFFRIRGTFSPEELADEVIERVTNKAVAVSREYDGDPSLYFYGVAKNVFREYVRRPRPIRLIDHPVLPDEESESVDEKDLVMEECLDQLDPSERRLIIDYYSNSVSSRRRRREGLARELGISYGALRVRVCRIRKVLRASFKARMKDREQ